MAQFDAFELPGGQWVVDVQSNLLDIAGTVVVVPLVIPDANATVIRRLNPLIDIDGQQRIMATHLVSVVRRSSLSRRIGTLVAHDDEIKAALDMLVGGI